MTRIQVLLHSLALALTACSGHAATAPATPATVQRLLDGARSGDIIRLGAGSYDAISVTRQSWDKPVVVEAGDATLSTVTLRNVAGLTWRGGTFDGRDTQRIGLVVVDSTRLVIEGTRMRNYLRAGIAMTRASDTRLTGNVFDDMGSDGIDLAMSRRMVIDGTRCHGFKPTPGAHPDCIQLWSRPTDPPTADVTITNSDISGDVQGVTMFNHVRDGIDDGGFDRIIVADNVVKSQQWNGITLVDCRNCIARNNRVETIPNGRIKSRLLAKGTGGVLLCGNIIASYPTWPGQQPCSTKGEARK